MSEMFPEERSDLADFWIAGINYRKTDAGLRGRFAISNDQYAALLTVAGESSLRQLFVLSTCNRTEIYGFAPQADRLIGLLCRFTEGSEEMFRELAYVKNGAEAVDHLMQVSAGLDSQVLGDYEIVGQMKAAVKAAKVRGFIGPVLERLLNNALQASKFIKNHTRLSGGTVSVSFAATQYIREQVADYKDKKILLLGTGKIGCNTGKNLVDYLGVQDVTLINRTFKKAEELGKELGLHYAPIEDCLKHIKRADIIITATNAKDPIITKAHLADAGPKLIIDLSIPYNVEAGVEELEGVQLVNVDALSKLKDETLLMRQAEVPKAKDIIREHLAEFMEWYEMRRHVPVLKAIKHKLQQLEHCPLATGVRNTGGRPLDTDERIRKVVNTAAVRMKAHNIGGCHYIEAINHFFTN